MYYAKFWAGLAGVLGLPEGDRSGQPAIACAFEFIEGSAEKEVLNQQHLSKDRGEPGADERI